MSWAIRTACISPRVPRKLLCTHLFLLQPAYLVLDGSGNYRKQIIAHVQHLVKVGEVFVAEHRADFVEYCVNAVIHLLKVHNLLFGEAFMVVVDMLVCRTAGRIWEYQRYPSKTNASVHRRTDSFLSVIVWKKRAA